MHKSITMGLSIVMSSSPFLIVCQLAGEDVRTYLYFLIALFTDLIKYRINTHLSEGGIKLRFKVYKSSVHSTETVKRHVGLLLF